MVPPSRPSINPRWDPGWQKRGKKESSSHASGIKPASQCMEKKLDVSSDVRLTEQPKLKKKKPQLKWLGIVVGGKLSGNEL